MTSRAIVYPLQTATIRLLRSQVTLRELPRLFTNGASFKGLYNGFSSNMLWSLSYGIVVAVGPIVEEQLKQASLKGDLYYGVTHLVLLPLRVKAILDQAGTPIPFSIRSPTVFQYLGALGISGVLAR